MPTATLMWFHGTPLKEKLSEFTPLDPTLWGSVGVDDLLAHQYRQGWDSRFEPGFPGLIGQRVLARLLAPRRHRTSTRKVKSPMSRYSGRRDDGRLDRSRIITNLAVTVLEPGPEQPPSPMASRDDRHTVSAQRRQHRMLALLQDEPTHLWRPAEIAARFGDVTLRHPGCTRRPTRRRRRKRGCRNGSALIPLTVAEIRRPLDTLLPHLRTDRNPVTHALKWSTWRRHHQAVAHHCHYRKRVSGHEPLLE